MLDPARDEARQQTLHRLEGVIEDGMTHCEAVGEALAQIRRAKLYRLTTRSWEQYCRQRWDMSARHARNLIVAARTAKRIAEKIGSALPKLSVRQLNEAAKLPAADLDNAVVAAAETANGHPTAQQIAIQVNRRLPRKAKVRRLTIVVPDPTIETVPTADVPQMFRDAMAKRIIADLQYAVLTFKQFGWTQQLQTAESLLASVEARLAGEAD